MLPKILRDIIEWNDIAQVPINSDSMKLYKKLIDEEYGEFVDAFTQNEPLNFESKDLEVEELDGLVDMVWVIMGYARARGWSTQTIENAFDNVNMSNYSKFVLENGQHKCIKREDGKILKPSSFIKADLLPIINANIYVSN